MADSLIETVASNPYESIVSDTTGQINNIQEDIQKVTSAINKLESASPTSPTLPKLRERLAELTSKLTSLTNTNDSAKSLLNSYNESIANANTMQGIYQLKQAELNRAQERSEAEYNKMAEDVKRAGENYINALGNATASENAIINANAAREGASAQSTAEARARNYLSNAQAQAEAYGNVISNLNAINEGKVNSNAGYVQLSQSNADNTLRQQVMNDFEAQLNAANNAAKYGSSGSGYGSSNSKVTLPDTTRKTNTNTNTNTVTTTTGGGNTTNGGTSTSTPASTPVSDFFDAELAAGTYGTAGNGQGKYDGVYAYQNNRLGAGRLKNGYFGQTIADLDRDKVSAYIEKQNQNNGHGYESFNLDRADTQLYTDTDGTRYVVFYNTYKDSDSGKEVKRTRVVPLADVIQK